MRYPRAGLLLLLPALLLPPFLAPGVHAGEDAAASPGDDEAPRATESWPPGGVPLFELPDTVMVEARRYGYGTPQVKLLYDYLRPDLGDTLLPRPSDFALRPRTMRLSRFGCTMYGADQGANTALFLGGIGNFIGLWDEKTAFYMMGAGAALGALWGGTAGADDSGFRIRIDTRSEP